MTTRRGESCRKHESVQAVMGCPTCARIFWERQEILKRRLDELEATEVGG